MLASCCKASKTYSRCLFIYFFCVISFLSYFTSSLFALMSRQLQLIPSFLITDPLVLHYRGLYLTLWALVYERRIVLNPDLDLLKQQGGSKGYLLTLIRAITPAHTHTLFIKYIV